MNIDIWTHAIENDFIRAAKINELHVEDRLRKKKVAKEGCFGLQTLPNKL
ncbi:unnamed protein product [Eruca vesicaria subsp. sativa]|uniref:Uncharacterized protein n=1 Tax=Eruca vesicaria subsp. sativa TaxID=29727 RepID=A0ABC8LSH7_ERUVS|nr:unnamed protein product [Eruca vesicaria subsp. sativa]